MSRLVLEIPEDLDRALTETSERTHCARDEIVESALRSFLSTQPASKPADRVHDLIGSVETGVPDLAENHREHIARSLRRAP